jgi:hypothetical protein
MKSKIKVNFFYILGLFSCHWTKTSRKIVIFMKCELVGTEENPKNLKSRGTKVVMNNMKQLLRESQREKVRERNIQLDRER